MRTLAAIACSSPSFRAIGVSVALATLGFACEMEPTPDPRNQTIAYRDGTIAWDYTSSGERGNVAITEVFWSGSVEGNVPAYVHHPDDVFIELHNRHPRPISMKNWVISITAGTNLDTLGTYQDRYNRATRDYVLATPENNVIVEPFGYVLVAARRDGAFRDADYYVEDLQIPTGPFHVLLRDADDRLIDEIGDVRRRPFAGGFDGVTSRSMERTQLLFGNRGNVNVSWHAYSLHEFSPNVREGEPLHDLLRSRVHPDYRALTGATPGMPNSPDYSGNISSGSFE